MYKPKTNHNTEEALNNIINFVQDLTTLTENRRYWKKEALTRTKVTTCKNCIWCDEDYLDQTGKYSCTIHEGFVTDDDLFYCKSGTPKNSPVAVKEEPKGSGIWIKESEDETNRC